MSAATVDRPAPTPATMRLLQFSLLAAVLSFAWLRFSDNTVDNDLWGHVLYGQRYVNQGHVRGPEPFSWTAPGFDIVNHEYLAEIVVGQVHRIAGGTGLWLYMLVMGGATVAFALWEGSRPAPSRHWAGLLLFGASINFIALGFAVRPQLFTTLFLVLELFLLRQLAAGRRGWGLLLPPLLGLWINFHGGVLAGLIVFAALAAAETCHACWPRTLPPSWEAARPPRKNLRLSWILAIAATAALLLNPWGYRLIEWNLRATLRPRPEIHEWHALAFSAANVPYYLVAATSLLAWIFSRRPKKLWEAATLLVLSMMGLLHQRHAPLFGLANLVLSPVHLDDAARRLAPYCRDLMVYFSRPFPQTAAALGLLVAGGAALSHSFARPKEHPFTMEVERDVYPVAAIEFIQAQKLFGKTITFFDWGQQHLWELPQNPVSFDGRFDTGYPPQVIAAHWDFYRGARMSPEINWSEAELAVLPTGGGGMKLLFRAGWRAVYLDPLAIVLVPPTGRHAHFRAGEPPERRGEDALRGREPFPDAPPVLATIVKPP